jgi:Flp pilus assembly protein TadG
MMMKHRAERGVVVVMMAVLTAVLLFMVGLAVDLGIMYAVRNSAQNAADAAALAGAYAYSGANPYNSNVTDAANKASLANPIFGGTTVSPSSVTPFRCTDSLGIQNYCVTTVVNVNSPMFFAKVFGWQPAPIRVTATAQAVGGLGYETNCARPIFIPDVVPPANTPIQNLAAGTILPNIRPTDPCNGGKGNCTPSLTPSTYYSLDFSSLLTPASNPNAVYPVAFSDGSADTNGGDALYRDTWTKCMVTALHCGQQVRVQTGETGNPTTRSVKTLINAGQTTIYAPVWDASQTVVNGNNMYATIVGFAEISNLTCANGCNGPSDTISATFQQYLGCNGGSVIGRESGSYASPVMLVHGCAGCSAY